MNSNELKQIVRDILAKHNVSLKEFANCYYCDAEFKAELEGVVGSFQNIFCERTEGGGDYDGAQSVVYFKDHDVYLSIEGSYYSEDGCDFSYADDLDIVEPVEVKAIQYRKVKRVA